MAIDMSKIHPVYLDSNFCKNPHYVKQYGPYSGVALDLLVFVASKTHRPNYKTNPINLHVHQHIYFHAQDFCKTFNHPRQLAHSKLPPAQVKELQKYPKSAQKGIVSQLDFTLFMMTAKNTMFDEGDSYKIAGPDGRVLVEWQAVQVFSTLITNRAVDTRADTQPISYQLDVLASFIGNNHHRGQGFLLADYLNICVEHAADVQQELTINKSGTPRKKSKARTWPTGRRLFLRLIWKLGMWQEESRRSTRTQDEDYEELCEIANLTSANERQNASRLRDYLEAVCRLGNLPFTAEVVKVQSNYLARQLTGKTPPPYRVVLTKKAGKQQPGEQQSLAM
jgi:hypothetical protein